MLTSLRRMSKIAPAKIVSQKSHVVAGMFSSTKFLDYEKSLTLSKVNSRLQSISSTCRRTIPNPMEAQSVSLLAASGRMRLQSCQPRAERRSSYHGCATWYGVDSFAHWRHVLTLNFNGLEWWARRKVSSSTGLPLVTYHRRQRLSAPLP